MAVISPNVSSGPYVADGTQTAFPFAFSIVAAGDVTVEIDGTAIAPALYTIAFDDVAGTVTFQSPPASGARILILSSPDYLQASQFDNQAAYNLTTVNAINRRATIRDLVNHDKADRAVKAPRGEKGLTIPSIADRADRLVAFGPSGDGAPLVALSVGAATFETVAGLDGQIADIAAHIAPISLVAADLAGDDTIGTIAANMADVAAVGSHIGNVNLVAEDLSLGGSSIIARAPLAAESAAVSAANAAGSALAAALNDPTSFNYSSAIWPETLKALLPSTYVNQITGDDLRSSGTYYAPVKTASRAIAIASAGRSNILLAAGQRHPMRGPSSGLQFGSPFADAVQLQCLGYGSATVAPLIDARQDLSTKVWTAVTGLTNAWETTTTLLTAPVLVGIEQANSSKFRLYHDGDDADPSPGGKTLVWITNNESVAANDNLININPGAWGINIVGSTAGDIRTTGSSSTAVRIVVHLADSSNPNGKPLRLCDSQAAAIFFGGDHGHIRLIGGAGKDNATFGPVNGVIPTLQSYEAIDFGCHGGVGPRNVIGLSKVHLMPVEQESANTDRGQTFGGAYHLFNNANLAHVDAFCGELDLKNGATGLYAHGASGIGQYRSIIIRRRSRIENCQIAVAIDGGPYPKVPFLTDGLYFEGGVDIINSTTAFKQNDDPKWIINGGSFVSDRRASAVLASFVGSNNVMTIKNFIVDMTPTNSGPPNYFGRILCQWNPYYGYNYLGENSPSPRLILDNVQDVTKIGTYTKKMVFYGSSSSYPNASRVHLELRNGTTLGDLWSYNNWDTYPESLFCDTSAVTLGFGGKTRAQVRAAMASLGRSCTLPDTVTMVDATGAIVDAPL